VLIPLQELLVLPAFARAAPLVLSGEPDQCHVRWVHSSEVFEMGPLLSGGELLLTTGLGLRGVPPRALADYVEALADAGLAALAIELGRTFSEIPTSIVESARRRRLTLLAFREIVPFEAMVQSFHELVLDRRVPELRVADSLWQQLIEASLESPGIHPVLHKVTELVSGSAFVVSSDERIIAAAPQGAPSPAASAENSRTVESGGVALGRLVVDAPHYEFLAAVLDRASKVLALELRRTLAVSGEGDTALLRDIVAHQVPSAEELRSRCELAGLALEPGRPLLALAVAGDRKLSTELVRTAVARAGRACLGACLTGVLDGDVVLVSRAPSGPEPRVRELIEQLSAQAAASTERAGGQPVLPVAVSSAVSEVTELHRAICQAQEVATLARRLGMRRRAVLARDVGTYRLLARLGDEPELNEFLRDQLGPLLDHDAHHSTDLVRTLDSYLRNGLAKSETAGDLGIRRQTLYNRLERIEAVLARRALSDHDARHALALALQIWRLRTGLDPSGPAS
jgi:purine catabolism regulator